MKEPFRTLFDGYEEHWLLSPYLTGDEPDWQGLEAEPRLDALSSGELEFLRVAFWFADQLGGLDGAHRLRIAQALLLTCSAGAP